MSATLEIKVSQLPDALQPLSGTEQVMLVQDGASVKAPVSAVRGVVVVLGGEEIIVAAAGANDNVAVDVDNISRLLVDTTAGAARFTGMTAGSDGQLMVATNAGPNTLEIANQDAGSLAANQYYGVTDITLVQGGSQLFSYSGTLDKWVMV